MTEHLELGSGVSLDRNWDIFVDESTGDLSFSQAGEEVRKDLAFNVALELTDRVGGVPTQGQLRDIEQVVRRVVLNDDRIETINQLDIEYLQRQQELEIDIRATTVADTTIDDVFTTRLTQ